MLEGRGTRLLMSAGRAARAKKKEEKKRQLVDCQLASLVYTAQDLLVKRNQAPESTAD